MIVNGRIGYTGDSTVVYPTKEVLATAQKRLIELEKSATEPTEKEETWLLSRKELLRKAKELGPINLPEPFSLAELDGEDLLGLLSAEGHLWELLPESPAAELARRKEDQLLLRYASDPSRCIEPRALAALALGAIRGKEKTSDSSALTRKQHEKLIVDCYRWGMRAGERLTPAIAIKLLREGVSEPLCHRLSTLLTAKQVLKPSSSDIQTLLCKGLSEESLEQIVEGWIAQDVLEATIRERSKALPDKSSYRTLKHLSEQLDSKRAELLERVERLMTDCMMSTASGDSITAAGELILNLCETFPPESLLEGVIQFLSSEAFRLSPQIQSAFLRLLNANRSKVWKGKKRKAKGHGSIEIEISTDHDFALRIQTALTLLKNTEHVQSMIENGLLYGSIAFKVESIEVLNKVIQWRKDLSLDIGCITDILDLQDDIGSFEVASKKIDELVTALRSRVGDKVDSLHIRVLVQTATRSKTPEKTLSTIIELINRLDGLSNSQNGWMFANSILPALLLVEREEKHRDHLLTVYNRFLKGHEGFEWNHRDSISIAVYSLLAVILALRFGFPLRPISKACLTEKAMKNPDNPEVVCEIFELYLKCFNQMTFTEVLDITREGAEKLTQLPALAWLLSDKFIDQPRRCFKTLTRLGTSYSFGEKSLTPLVKLERLFSISELANESAKRKNVVRAHSRGWREVLQFAPDSAYFAYSFILAKSICKESSEPPQSLVAILNKREKLSKEKEFLARLLEKEPDRNSIKKRLESISRRLNEPSTQESFLRKSVSKKIRYLSNEAEFAAIENLIASILRKQLSKIAGPEAGGIEIEEDLLNALLLTQDVENNGRLLRKLIRSSVNGDSEWRYRIAKNSEFLDELKKRGTNPETWLAENLEIFPMPAVKGGLIKIHLETNPLSILQMGNYFDTCLSFGQFNSFSTVTNACDLNKRVIFVTDRTGTIVARKLIGITTEGKLVGFHTYSTLSEKKERRDLTKLINRFVKDFADKCSLELADSGDIEPLSSTFWYDDGTVPWSASAINGRKKKWEVHFEPDEEKSEC